MESRGKITDYLSAIEQFPPEREALVTVRCTVTFGTLTEEARRIRAEENLVSVSLPAGSSCTPVSSAAGTAADTAAPSVPAASAAPGTSRSTAAPQYLLSPLKPDGSFSELARFIAYSGTRKVPLFLPRDISLSEECLCTAVPARTAMAVMTSGSSGRQKLYFRTFESWYDFFPVQNRILSMGAGTRCFFAGSPAFTGSLNLVLAQLASGGTVISEELFDPRLWLKRIERDRADVIYLIPSKLRALTEAAGHPAGSAAHASPRTFPGVRSIVSGSQSLGKRDAGALRRIFPHAALTLYYGASELSYVTYLRGSEMGADPSVIGRPFPGISVRADNAGLLHVTTSFGVTGLPRDAAIGDLGHRNKNGLWCFDGRADDLLNLRGRKVSAQKVQNALLSVPGVRDAAVLLLPAAKDGSAEPVLTAALVLEKADPKKADPLSLRRLLSASLLPFEIPRRFVLLPELPKNESGKTDRQSLKKQLQTM